MHNSSGSLTGHVDFALPALSRSTSDGNFCRLSIRWTHNPVTLLLLSRESKTYTHQIGTGTEVVLFSYPTIGSRFHNAAKNIRLQEQEQRTESSQATSSTAQLVYLPFSLIVNHYEHLCCIKTIEQAPSDE